MFALKLGLATLVFCLTASHAIAARIRIVASTPDVAAIATAVGGADVDVATLTAGTEDPHEIDPKPSFGQKLESADLVVANGLGLEEHWLLPLIKQTPTLKSKLPAVLIELGEFITPLSDGETRPHSGGSHHLHSKGNPHFTLDPERVAIAGRALGQRLGQLDPKHASDYLKRAEQFEAHQTANTKRLRAVFSALKITGVLSYHASLNYFAKRFGLNVVGTLEDAEGSQPTAQHLNSLLTDPKYENVNLLLLEDLYPDLLAKKIVAERPKVRIARIPVSIGAEPQITSFETLYDLIALRIKAAVQ